MTQRRRMDSRDRRAAILESARKLFARKGLADTSTRELAKAAGVTQPLFYHYFSSKEALYRAMLLTVRDTVLADLQKILALPASTATLVTLVRAMASWKEERLNSERELLLRYLLHSLVSDGKFAKEALESHGSAAISEKICACIAAAIRSGDLIDSPVDRDLRMRLVRFTTLSIRMLALPSTSVLDAHGSRKDFMNQTAWFLLRGIGLKEQAIRRVWRPVQGRLR